MKKIILFLTLLSLGVSKAQVVGGYLPLNSTKSATMGGLKVAGNETVTGTFSVGSTASVSGNALFSSSVGIGALPTSSLSSLRVINSTSTVDIGRSSASAGAIWLQQSNPTSANYALNSDGSVVQLNSSNSGALNLQVNTSTKLGLNTGGVNVTGSLTASSTFSLGSANLTGGNTGTVAVLSDALFPVTMKTSALGQSPADGQTYYFANIQFPNFSTEQGNGKIYFPYNVTLVGWTANFYVGTTLGSAENSTLQVNINNSATNLSTAITMSALAQTYTNTGLSIDVNANSYVEAKLITPTWATNPTNVFAGIIFWFVRRS